MNTISTLFAQTKENNLISKPAIQRTDSKIEDYGIHIGGARKEKGITHRSKDSDKSPKRALPFWLPKSYLILQRNQLNLRKNAAINTGQQSDAYYVVIRKKRYYDLIISSGYASYEEAYNALPSLMVNEIIKIGMDTDGCYYLYKFLKTAGRKMVVKTGFKTEDEARTYRSESPLPLLEFKYTVPELPRLTKIVRNGIDYRGGQDITAKELCDTFGFPGIEFGNWLTQKERQQVLNHAFDAFMDLAHVTGLPYRAMSFNGLLAAAFGSRGIANALAHFEPGRFVFNLSRLKGAGSLAHEWFHALDNYICALALGIDMKRNSAGIIQGNDLGVFATARVFMKSEGRSWEAITDEFAKLKEIMRFRTEKVAFADSELYATLTGRVKRYERNLDIYSDKIMSLLKASYPHIKRGGEPANPEQLAEAKRLVKEIRDGNTGAECIHPNRASALSVWKYRSFEKLEELAKILKIVRNRDYFGDKGILTEYAEVIRWLKETRETIEKKTKEVEHVCEVKTNYYRDAQEIDKYRTNTYWSLPEEMAARAFGAFIEDCLVQEGKSSPYLVHSHTNKVYKGSKPYPEGAEREAINVQLRQLLNQVKGIL